jgi:hypothetical protein
VTQSIHLRFSVIIAGNPLPIGSVAFSPTLIKVVFRPGGEPHEPFPITWFQLLLTKRRQKNEINSEQWAMWFAKRCP